MRTFNQLALLLSKPASHRAGEPLAAHPPGLLPLLWAGIRPSKKRHVFPPRHHSYSPRCKTRGLLSGSIYLYGNKMSIPRGKLKGTLLSSLLPRGWALWLLTHFMALLAWYFRAPQWARPGFIFPLSQGTLGFEGEQRERRRESCSIYQMLGTLPTIR